LPKRLLTFEFLVFGDLFLDDFDSPSNQRFVNTTTSPVDDQSFSDTEQHNRDLSNRKEAPDGGLFHEVRSYQASEIWAECEKEDSLDNHSFLFVEGKEWSEHEERMNSGSRNDVSGVSHWYGPSKRIVTSVGAKLLASEPLSGGANKSLIPNVGNQETCEQHSSSNQTESFDDHVAIEVFLVFGKRSVYDVAEIWLKTDMKETQNG